MLRFAAVCLLPALAGVARAQDYMINDYEYAPKTASGRIASIEFVNLRLDPESPRPQTVYVSDSIVYHFNTLGQNDARFLYSTGWQPNRCEYSYDSAGRLVQEQTVYLKGNGPPRTVQFYYDTAGRLERKEKYDGGRMFSQSVYVYSANPHQETEQLRYIQTGLRYTYTTGYNGRGQKIRYLEYWDERKYKSNSIVYDDKGRLIYRTDSLFSRNDVPGKTDTTILMKRYEFINDTTASGELVLTQLTWKLREQPRVIPPQPYEKATGEQTQESPKVEPPQPERSFLETRVNRQEIFDGKGNRIKTIQTDLSGNGQPDITEYRHTYDANGNWTEIVILNNGKYETLLKRKILYRK